jgi:DNA-binding response OmpR family regulator
MPVEPDRRYTKGMLTDRPGRLVLVVEDDAAIAELVATYLGRDGFRVRISASAEEALACMDEAPDLVLLDLGLPGMDGLEFLRTFRSSSVAPVIIVSARESDEDKLEGLGLGADDFVTKPFSPRILAARVGALLRRVDYEAQAREEAGGLPGEAGTAAKAPGGSGEGESRALRAASLRRVAAARRLAFGPFVLDLDARLLSRHGETLRLSAREFELLAFLVTRPGRSFTAMELHAEVWRLEHGDLSTVAVHIQRIRRKIEVEPAEPRWIRTVPGAGYRFVPEDGN